MNHALIVPGGELKLQATLSSSSTGTGEPIAPHHPITCYGPLRLEGDGRLSCDHSDAPPGDSRTQFCIDHSIALLLIELSSELF
ncbi:MAG TPA: hypothetical protein VHL53_06725 [Acidimicrobiia bacterium]|nr:hypothetical protein [Acidimicrobiia bacterium]